MQRFAKTKKQFDVASIELTNINIPKTEIIKKTVMVNQVVDNRIVRVAQEMDVEVTHEVEAEIATIPYDGGVKKVIVADIPSKLQKCIDKDPDNYETTTRYLFWKALEDQITTLKGN